VSEEGDDSGEKTEDPSQHRIDEFRKKGDVATSKELSSVLILTGSMITLFLCTMYIYEIVSDYITWVYAQDASIFEDQKTLQLLFKKTIVCGLKSVAPVMLCSLFLGILAQVLQIGFLFSPDVLQLKFDRIDPIAGTKKLISKKSVVEVIKGLFKFAVIISITVYMVKDNLFSFIGYLHSEVPQSIEFSVMLFMKISTSILLGLAVVAAADFAWQKYQYKQKLMMSKQQAKEEHKSQEGNPEVKQQIRNIQRELSRKRMMSEVPTADVIVTNPTHLSVALKYDVDGMVAPQVIAKGSDHVALRIRELAKEHDIPIVENVPVARALYKTVKVGTGVPRTLYKAVAEILAFVYKIKRKKKAIS
jgi:flagellar biosynthetic protein FlhB